MEKQKKGLEKVKRERARKRRDRKKIAEGERLEQERKTTAQAKGRNQRTAIKNNRRGKK